MSELKSADSVSEFYPDDDSTREFAGSTRCPVHNREVPLDLRRNVGFCARCQREFHVWEISAEGAKAKRAEA